MATFTAGTSFTDGVTGDVTAAKLNALVADATPLANFITDRTAETSIATDDLVLISDTSDSGALNKMTVANLMKAELTGTINSTAGTITVATIPTLTAGTTTGTAATFTSGTITTGVMPTLTAGTTTSTAATITTGTIPTLVATTLITSGTGTAAAPAISPTGDTNTGIFFPTADTAAIATQGTEAIRVDSSGNVGIGVSSPTRQLDVNKTAIFDSSGLGTTTSPSIAIGSSGVGLSYIGSQNLVAITNNTERLRIDSSGNVGIGTSSPAARVDVRSASLATNSQGNLSLISTDSATIDAGGSIGFGGSYTGTVPTPWALIAGRKENSTDNNYASYLQFATRPQGGGITERLRIDSSGNVGVGTSSPSTKLHVASGNLRLDDNQYILWGGTTNGINGSNASNLLAFYTNSAERLRIDSSGFVSIGTATAISALHVHGNVTLSNTTTATSAGTGGLSKPNTYAGYLTVSINGTSRKIPYYAT